jgi:hypothetical protein
MSSKGIFTDCDDSKICLPKPCFNPKKNCEEYRCCVANAFSAMYVATISNLSGEPDTDAPFINFWKLSVGLLYGNCLDTPTKKNIDALSDYISATTQYVGATYSGGDQTLNTTNKVKFDGLEKAYPSGVWSQGPLTEIDIPVSGKYQFTVDFELRDTETYTPDTLVIKKNGIILPIEKISSQNDNFNISLNKNDMISIVYMGKTSLSIREIGISFVLLNGVNPPNPPAPPTNPLD